MTSVPGASWIFTRDQLDRAQLAYRMNDAPLPPHHGSPIRLVVPGWYGCACIKWVNLIAIVLDDEPATNQMREFAVRTQQDGEPWLARDYAAAMIDTAAIPVRVEKWIAGGRIEYRVTGILWGGSKPTNALSIRFRTGGPWVKVDDGPLPESTLTWTVWTHTWRPTEPGRYQIVLRVDDPFNQLLRFTPQRLDSAPCLFAPLRQGLSQPRRLAKQFKQGLQSWEVPVLRALDVLEANQLVEGNCG